MMKKGSIVGVVFALVGFLALLPGIRGKAEFEGQKVYLFETQPIETIWNTLVNDDGTFYSQNEKIDLQKKGSAVTWKETNQNNVTFSYALEQNPTEHTLTLDILKSDITLTGQWRIQLEQLPEGTRMIINEKSHIEKKWVKLIINMTGRTAIMKAIYKDIEKNINNN